jgi:hypothetical protein
MKGGSFMKRVMQGLALAILLSGLTLAQSSAPQSSPSTTTNTAPAEAAQPNKIAAGTVIPAELSKSVDAKKAKQGDKVEAKVAQDLLSNGQVVIPRGSKITGHVTTAKPHDKGDPASNLGIAFDQIEIKNKGPLQFQASIQAMAKPMNMVSPSMNPGGAAEPAGSAGTGNSGPMTGGAGRTGMSSPSAANSGATAPNDATAGSEQPAPSGTALSASSQGVVGMEGLTMEAKPGDAAQGTVISSADKNVKLESGTQLILRAN